MVALADVFDALTSTRPYKKSWTAGEAMEHIKASRGKQFDPKLADLFIELLPEVIEIRVNLPDESPESEDGPTSG
ncbi:MAG: HD domain-containing phosphohydrolase [Spirochaetota bacterium]